MHRGSEQQIPKNQRVMPARVIQAHIVSRIDLHHIGNGRQGPISITFFQPRRYEDAAILNEATGHTLFNSALRVERTSPLHPLTRDFPKLRRKNADEKINMATHDGTRATNRRGNKREFFPLPTLLIPKKIRQPLDTSDGVEWGPIPQTHGRFVTR